MAGEGLFIKALGRNEEISKEEVMDILFYVKEIFGLLLGVIVAVAGVMGLPGIIVFVLGISLLNYLYVYRVLGVDEQEVEIKDVLKEHFMNGFFPFLLTWVVTHNLIHYY